MNARTFSTLVSDIGGILTPRALGISTGARAGEATSRTRHAPLQLREHWYRAIVTARNTAGEAIGGAAASGFRLGQGRASVRLARVRASVRLVRASVRLVRASVRLARASVRPVRASVRLARQRPACAG